VISCPVFFLGPPAILKSFIDRVQSLWNRKYLLGIDTNPRDAEKNGFLL
jgi:multimeric flavodoxin WrbA